jgi:hypothetical protein
MKKKSTSSLTQNQDKEIIEHQQELLKTYFDSLVFGEKKEKEWRDSLKKCDKIVFKRESLSE